MRKTRTGTELFSCYNGVMPTGECPSSNTLNEYTEAR
jgi:hypothetical protein